ncbi:MAG: alpha/beta hydrolase [Candidatus Hodarchaeales archaeon]|jgi:predicted esterase
MNVENYRELLREASGLYQAGKYKEVIDFQKDAAKKFPDLKTGIYYSGICAAAKLEDYDLSLELLKEILDEGGWYSEMILRQSPSLHPLQGIPEYEKLSNISVERSKLATRKDRDLTVIPDNISPPYPLVLALHSNGGFINKEFEPWKTVVDHGYVLGMPRSTNGFWSGQDCPDWTDNESAINEIKAYVDKLIINKSLDTEHFILGGLSWGGGTALRLALTGIIPARGFIVVAPGGQWRNEPDKWQSLIEDAKNRDLRGMIIMGEEDTVISREDVQKLAKMLNDGEIPCRFIKYPGLGHWYPPDFADYLTSFIANL